MESLFPHDGIPINPYPLRRGHAARPGTGPAGKRCSDCEFIMRCKRMRSTRAAVWFKCSRTSSGPHDGRNVKARDPACGQFQQKNNDEDGIVRIRSVMVD